MKQLTLRHLARYLMLAKEKKIGAVWLDGPYCWLRPLGEHVGRGNFISSSDFALLIESFGPLEGGKIEPRTISVVCRERQLKAKYLKEAL